MRTATFIISKKKNTSKSYKTNFDQQFKGDQIVIKLKRRPVRRTVTLNGLNFIDATINEFLKLP